jgi:hypothetical protein
MKADGNTYTDNKGKAETLSKQFKSVFTQEDTNELPNKPPSPHPDVPPLLITSQGVAALLSKIKPHKATGPDDIPGRILKECSEEIAPALTFIFQQTLDTGDIPDDWRTANIVPVFKKGSRAKPANYRPVSLTSIPCKIIEHILVSHIMDHLDQHDILLDEQHGFRHSRSCESQLIITTHDLAHSLDNKTQVDMAILDFSKAFDRVPHKRLATKLEFYGIRHGMKRWLENLLSHRRQRVAVDGVLSQECEVLSGVPQGTVIGPLLFLLFINDITDNIKHSQLRLFADDCLIYKEVASREDQQALQEDLDTLMTWSHTWQMLFNVDKCYTMNLSLAC